MVEKRVCFKCLRIWEGIPECPLCSRAAETVPEPRCEADECLDADGD